MPYSQQPASHELEERKERANWDEKTTGDAGKLNAEFLAGGRSGPDQSAGPQIRF